MCIDRGARHSLKRGIGARLAVSARKPSPAAPSRAHRHARIHGGRLEDLARCVAIEQVAVFCSISCGSLFKLARAWRICRQP